MAKTVAQLRRRVTHLGFEAVRRPGVLFLHSLRKIPVVRKRVIPALLKEELDGIPASDAVEAVRREFERLQNTRARSSSGHGSARSASSCSTGFRF